MRFEAFTLFLAGFCSANYASDCDPLKSSCPENPALSTPVKLDFKQATNLFSNLYGEDRTKYTDNGLLEWFENHGDGPSLRSNFYILYGKLEIECEIPGGTGIISNFFLQSDDGDEIDFEWISSYPNQVQTNYFGKGITGNYDRGMTKDLGSQLTTTYHKYTIDWKEDETTWSVDGEVIRTLRKSDITQDGQHDYPSSPMRVFIGMWAGGDSKLQGTVQWAGGPTTLDGAPFKFNVKYFSAVNYSPAKSYSYADNSGNNININGGSKDSDPGAQLPNDFTTGTTGKEQEPTKTAISNGQIIHAVTTTSSSTGSSSSSDSSSSSGSTHKASLLAYFLALGASSMLII